MSAGPGGSGDGGNGGDGGGPAESHPYAANTGTDLDTPLLEEPTLQDPAEALRQARETAASASAEAARTEVTGRGLAGPGTRRTGSAGRTAAASGPGLPRRAAGRADPSRRAHPAGRTARLTLGRGQVIGRRAQAEAPAVRRAASAVPWAEVRSLPNCTPRASEPISVSRATAISTGTIVTVSANG